MPAINLPITALGPLLKVTVGVSHYRAAVLKKKGHQVPPGSQGTFLVDTGASGTCVDAKLLKPLGIQPTGSVDIQTPSTGKVPHPCSQYDVAILIPGMQQAQDGLFIPALAVIETSLSTQGIGGLLGRDVLDCCIFIYNAGLKSFTLAY
jgi:hypothetical protein